MFYGESVSISSLFQKKVRLAFQTRMSLTHDKLKLCFVMPFGNFRIHVAERLDVLSERKRKSHIREIRLSILTLRFYFFSTALLDKVRSCIHGNYDAKHSHLMFQ